MPEKDDIAPVEPSTEYARDRRSRYEPVLRENPGA
jgi:hypothetical protein